MSLLQRSAAASAELPTDNSCMVKSYDLAWVIWIDHCWLVVLNTTMPLGVCKDIPEALHLQTRALYDYTWLLYVYIQPWKYLDLLFEVQTKKLQNTDITK